MSVAAVAPHRDAIWTLLQAIPHLAWYEGRVPSTPPLDPDKRVHAYGVFWPGIGKPAASKVCARTEDLDWRFTVGLYAGDVERWLLARDAVCAALIDVAPTVAGRVLGRIRMDYAAGYPGRTDDPLPERFGAPLLFTVPSVPA